MPVDDAPNSARALSVTCIRHGDVVVLSTRGAAPLDRQFGSTGEAVAVAARWLEEQLDGRRVEIRAGRRLVGVAVRAPMALALVAKALAGR